MTSENKTYVNSSFPISIPLTTAGKQIDLLYVDSILVSTGMNENDDVFLGEELHAAKDTIKDKPMNWGHQHTQIIGHMVRSFLAEKNGERISEDDVKALPKNFDVQNKAVIYKKIFPDKAQFVIDGAKNNELFVSMECWFDDYDYLVGEDIVKRNHATSFLDKVLRRFGGTGKFANKRVGRVLRGICFGGVGIVEKPANPDSVIKSVADKTETDIPNDALTVILDNVIGTVQFSEKNVEDVIFPTIEQRAVANTQAPAVAKKEEEVKEEMADEKILQLEKELAETKKFLEEANKRISEFNEVKIAKQIEDLNKTILEKDEKIKEIEAKMNEAIEASKKSNEKTEALEKELEEVRKQSSEAEALLGKIVEEHRLTSRMKKLSEFFKLSDEDLNKVKSAISELDDEEFDAYIEDRKRFAKSLLDKARETKKGKADADPANDETVITEILESAETQDSAPDMNTDTSMEEDSVEKSMASAVAELFPDDKKE